MNKRIVLRYSDDLEEIIGETSVQPPDIIERGQVIFNLVALKRSYYLYKPMVVPGDAHMRYSKDQR